jgi:hypothetical protein
MTFGLSTPGSSHTCGFRFLGPDGGLAACVGLPSPTVRSGPAFLSGRRETRGRDMVEMVLRYAISSTPGRNIRRDWPHSLVSTRACRGSGDPGQRVGGFLNPPSVVPRVTLPGFDLSTHSVFQRSSRAALISTAPPPVLDYISIHLHLNPSPPPSPLCISQPISHFFPPAASPPALQYSLP